MQAYLQALDDTKLYRRSGRVSQYVGLVVEADGPEAFLGERCEIYSHANQEPVMAEVVGLKRGKVLLMPYGNLQGISVGSDVIATGQAVDVPVGEQLLGRVIDAFGNPLDGGEPLNCELRYALHAEPKNPLSRPRIDAVLETGVRAIDSLLTIGRGQRMGIFAGSGVGKSTLLGMIARNMNADINVIALIGERGREVLDFIEQTLGQDGLERSVVIVATSDQPALVRAHAALAAAAIAEFFRDRAKDVVLTMDSITRFAMAQREIGLAVGEPPTARGYTPSVFALLPRLLERGGTSDCGGSITAFYTVLTEGDDLHDPISDSIRAILDGGVVLSRDLANQRHYPAIDVLQSNSRLLPNLASEADIESGKAVVKCIDMYVNAKDMIDIGAYRKGANPKLDKTIALMPMIDQFLTQRFDEATPRADALAKMGAIVAGGRDA